MKMYQVTDHSTGEIFDIEAESASIAGQAFLKEGRSVTIKPLNVNQEVNTMDTTQVNKTTNPKEGKKMIKEYLVETLSLHVGNDKLSEEDKAEQRRIQKLSAGMDKQQFVKQLDK